ncbi:GH3 family domain-containing protein [Phormidium sp. CCY1219]|uniref:GH3 family domain-containing protein n=1 Tax=Phormidium sp. CCY1219 TaxID=2886104 RepID=UPI002D1F0D28|nr:GH3 auxin-responsive promoter family protein [Phormidium sp. CCY1219]MEB3831430.1 GH3 auxin-responsive promoter family protein [Phormidium sp. CCY1219]
MIRLTIKLFAKLLQSHAKRFRKALENPQTAQELVQRELLRRLAASEYGKSLGIAEEGWKNPAENWQRIPIVEYDEIKSWIETPGRNGNSEASKKKLDRRSSLTPEPILFYEKTSGSRGTAKWIPYSKSLRRSFHHLFCIWAEDLIKNGPEFCTGKLYFCISPQVGDRETESQVTRGLEDDSDYLEEWLRWFLRPFLVSPAGLNRIRDVAEFKEKLCLALLAEENLEIISIWSPSFLQIHLDYIAQNHKRLVENLGGRISVFRAVLLEQSEIPWSKVWPHLKLISCWDSAHSAQQAEGLRRQFPQVLVQGKGLLATEAPMTIPLIAAGGFVPILDEVFFEFEDNCGRIFPLQNVRVGEAYSVIISQKGGLYRYRIGDRIRVTHFYRQTPCLEFIGRCKATSDLVGEKLHESFVCDIIKRLNVSDTFFKIVVSATKPTAHYLLLLDRANRSAEEIAQQFDAELMRSPHYCKARAIGQLSAARVLISPQMPNRMAQYRTDGGKKWGDLKPEVLAIAPIEEKFLAELEKHCIKSGSSQPSSLA